MRIRLITGMIIILVVTSLSCSAKNARVIMKTTKGEIHLELYTSKAPETVKNFLKYVDMKHFDGTIFHRVISNFMIQGGGFTSGMIQKGALKPIKNEADNGVQNQRGTIAMARTSAVNSATSQFFINVKDNPFLNHKNKTPRGYGYCAFGRVTKGMDVVDIIKSVPTHTAGYHQNVPVEDVMIISIRRVKGK